MTCETTMDTIRYMLEEEQPLDPCEMLQLIDIAIAKVTAGIASGDSVTYLEIRNRRVQYANTNETLQTLRQQRIEYASQCARKSNKSQRNIGTFKRIR